MNGGVLYTSLVCPDASYVHLPLIAIVHPLPADWQRLVEAVATVGDADILLFTSRNAVSWWTKAMQTAGSAWTNARVVAIGNVTAEALNDSGATNVTLACHDDSYGVIETFRGFNGRGRVVVPRSDLAFNIIPDGLRRLGYAVECLTAYRTVMPAGISAVSLDGISTIVFTSPSTIDNFVRLYGCLPADKTFVTRGRVTRAHLNSVLAAQQKNL